VQQAFKNSICETNRFFSAALLRFFAFALSGRGLGFAFSFGSIAPSCLAPYTREKLKASANRGRR
jgi:hypothetical protein